jgi:AcrR family transcriptional regulator
MGCERGCPGCERLRAAALELIGEGGIENLSLESLAARTGGEPAEVAAHYATSRECIYETYDEVAGDLRREMMEAFEDRSDWQEGFEAGRRRMLERLAANPAEARLCFVEPLRGDRGLRRRRDASRRSMVDFLTREYARSGDGTGMRPIQIELLIGAGFQAISRAVAQDGGVDPGELDSSLTALESCFLPVHA